MSVCLHISQKPLVQTSRNFLYTLIVAVARSYSDNNAIHYVPLVLWMTQCLPIISQEKAKPIWRTPNVSHQRQNRGQSLVSMIAFSIHISFLNSSSYDCRFWQPWPNLLPPRKWELGNYMWNVGQRSSV